MNARWIVAACAFGLTCAAAGCGTVLNNWWFTPDEGGERIYGGVAVDAEMGSQCFREAFLPDDQLGAPRVHSRPVALAYGVYLLGLDLPLSVFGDTLTLPRNFSASMRRASADDPRPNDEWRRFWLNEQPSAMPRDANKVEGEPQ
jgi:uncharacterized protein YceK